MRVWLAFALVLVVENLVVCTNTSLLQRCSFLMSYGGIAASDGVSIAFNSSIASVQTVGGDVQFHLRAQNASAVRVSCKEGSEFVLPSVASLCALVQSPDIIPSTNELGFFVQTTMDKGQEEWSFTMRPAGGANIPQLYLCSALAFSENGRPTVAATTHFFMVPPFARTPEGCPLPQDPLLEGRYPSVGMELYSSQFHRINVAAVLVAREEPHAALSCLSSLKGTQLSLNAAAWVYETAAAAVRQIDGVTSTDRYLVEKQLHSNTLRKLVRSHSFQTDAKRVPLNSEIEATSPSYSFVVNMSGVGDEDVSGVLPLCCAHSAIAMSRRTTTFQNPREHGEHYQLLRHFARQMSGDDVIVELGTRHGCSALALSGCETIDGTQCGRHTVYTFDLAETWHDNAHACLLSQEEFRKAVPNVHFVRGNILEDFNGAYHKLLLNARLIFLDTEHLGDFETQVAVDAFNVLDQVPTSSLSVGSKSHVIVINS